MEPEQRVLGQGTELADVVAFTPCSPAPGWLTEGSGRMHFWAP